MFSIYVSLFNIEKNNFPWKPSLENFVSFAGEDGEVVVAVNQSEDNTLQIIKDFAAQYSTVKVVETSFSYEDIEFDGKIKNAALQATTKPLKIQMDADELFVLSQRPKWEKAAERLVNSSYQCLLVPSLDLFGSTEKIKGNANIGQKFRMHKDGLRRGVWKFAWMGDKIDTTKSDTTELLDENGDLVSCTSSVGNPMDLHPMFCENLANSIYTVHTGYLSFEHRLNINNKIWKDHWSLRSGREENVVSSIKELENQPTIYHNLKIQ
jgi:glycosyltransferase involved in cell wall biosynthesis